MRRAAPERFVAVALKRTLGKTSLRWFLMQSPDLGDTYPHPSSPASSAVMRANRRTDTGPEIRLRSALHRLGLRFRKDYPVKTRLRVVRVDVVFPKARVAVFVDGCYWHSCPEHGVSPRANSSYWGPKLARNVERDREVDAALVDEGWRVIRVWEHEEASQVALRVSEALRSGGR